jgi:hypothetical protein
LHSLPSYVNGSFTDDNVKVFYECPDNIAKVITFPTSEEDCDKLIENSKLA